MATNGSKSLNLWDNYVQIINGKSSPTEKSHRGVNPATLENKPDVPVATQDDLNQAVDAGRKAFKSWSKVPWEERKKKLFEWADAIEAQKNDFRDLLISEQGKPVRFRWRDWRMVANGSRFHKLPLRPMLLSLGFEARLVLICPRKSLRIVRLARS